MKHHVPLGTKVEALGIEKRTEALRPFVACIRKHLGVAAGIWVDTKASKALPSQFFRVFGDNPAYMAFMRVLLQVADLTPDGDRIVLVCDEDEETVLKFYALYKRAKKVVPAIRKKVAAISFCDDTAVLAVQAADFVASMVPLDALARRDKKKHQYRRLYEALIADPERHERIWYYGVAAGDKDTLATTAQNVIEQLKREGKIQ